MKQFLLGIITCLLLGIFVFLGVIVFGNDNTKIEAEHEVEASTEEDGESDVKENNANEKQLNKNESADNKEDKQYKENELMTPAELEEELINQEVVVQDVEYIIQDERLKSLYPDMISAIVKNNSDDDIRDLTYAFVAWDEKGLPIKIKASIDFSDGVFFYEGIGESVNLASGDVHGENYGFELDDKLDEIHSYKAIVTEYEGFNGEKWKNPLIRDFKRIYEGKRLSDIDDIDKTVVHRFDPSYSSSKTVDENQQNTSSTDDNNIDIEEFISGYFSDLESAYSTGDFGWIEVYFKTDTNSYTQMRNNVQSQSFPNLLIHNFDIVVEDRKGDRIYIEVLSDRTNDNLGSIQTYRTGYTLINKDGHLIIESYKDL